MEIRTLKKSVKKPYIDRTDEEKLLSNVKKAISLFNRRDWSASIMRMATASEIASNIYIRQFLQEKHKLPEDVVASLLKSSNGIAGKFRQLISPAAKSLDEWDKIKKIQKQIESINTHRNEVAHAGYFKNKPNAKSVLNYTVEVIGVLAPNVEKPVRLTIEKYLKKKPRTS